MAFEDSSQTGAARSLGVSSGEFRAVQRDTQSFPALPAGPSAGADPMTSTAVQPNLHYVFDDPNDGEPGRDRMLVHGLWEFGLAVLLVIGGYLLIKARPGALSGDSLRDIFVVASFVGLLGVASAVALRAGVPNLAVGGVAVVAGILVSQDGSGSLAGRASVAIGICAALGLVQGLVVVLLHVPSWAASLGAALAVGAWAATQELELALPGYDPADDAYLWFIGIATASVGASLISLAPGLRRGFGRFRPIGDPARRRTRAATVIAVSATVVSTMLGGLAGVLAVLGTRAPAAGNSAELTALGLAAALLGGTSAFGRRGGVFGTMLAACLLTVALAWADAAHPTWQVSAVVAAAIGLGLVATRLVERFGRPVLLLPEDEDTWMPRVHGLNPAGTPLRPTNPPGGLWTSDDGWGSPR